MSLKTWELEFYPVSAREVGKEDAVEHSLRKWEGLRAEQLEKHGVIIKRNEKGIDAVCEGNPEEGLPIYTGTCALCELYLDENALEEGACWRCPLAQARDGISCDTIWLTGEEDEETNSPWTQFYLTSNPEPMITALRLTQEWEEKNAQAGE